MGDDREIEEAERRYRDACREEAEAWWASHQEPADAKLKAAWQAAFHAMTTAIAELMTLLDKM